jgi:hypothetical protein
MVGICCPDRLLRLILAAVAVAVAGVLAGPPALSARQAVAAPLVFRDAFWISLHHFLYVLGRASNGESDATRDAVASAPLEVEAASLGTADRDTWQAAVAGYARDLAKLDAVFSDRLIDVSLALAATPDDAVRPNLPKEATVAAVLERAAPIYRREFHPAHRAANARAIAAIQPLVAKHAASMIARVERAWQQRWPAAGVPILVSGYTNWAGAYSTRGPLVVMAGTDERLHGETGFEIVFHEALHQWDDAMQNRLKAAGARTGRPVPAQLNHAMIFYAAGDAARREFGSAYAPYADRFGIWTRGSGAFKPALDAHWKPYLDGSGTLDDTLDAMLRALTRRDPSSPVVTRRHLSKSL